VDHVDQPDPAALGEGDEMLEGETAVGDDEHGTPGVGVEQPGDPPAPQGADGPEMVRNLVFRVDQVDPGGGGAAPSARPSRTASSG
jgi:hypothetical protein